MLAEVLEWGGWVLLVELQRRDGEREKRKKIYDVIFLFSEENKQ